MADNFDEINEAAKKFIEHLNKKDAEKKSSKAANKGGAPLFRSEGEKESLMLQHGNKSPYKKPSIKTEVTNEMMGPDEALMRDVEKVAAPKKKAASAPEASSAAEPSPAKPKAVKKSASPKGKSVAQPAVEAAENVNPARHAQLLEEFGAGGSKIPEIKGIPEPTMGSMYRDMSDAGGKAMKIAAELEPGAAERAAMARIKPSIADKLAAGATKIGIGKVTPKSMAMAGLAGGAVGLGLQALMEGLDAEPAGNPHADHVADLVAQRKAQMRGAIAPEMAQHELPRDVKKPQQRQLRYVKDEHGQQQEMEDMFAEQLKKNPY